MFVFVLLCINLCPFKFCNHPEEEERAGCFAFNFLQISCYRKCLMALPRGAVGWSLVCDCSLLFLGQSIPHC